MESLPVEKIIKGTGSEIRDFYRGKCIFITGGIGFIGKVLIDTILRKCPDIESIYVLVRARKGKTGYERLAETLKSSLFQGLSDQLISKIYSLEGNVESSGLGLSIEDSLLLKTKAQIVIHCAANVRFDEKLRVSLTTNVKGTLNFLELCRDMTKLESIVYVSTAFSNSHRDDVDEKFYDPPLDVENALTITKFDDDMVMRMLEPILLGKWPNTYAFSKAITENLIKLKAVGLPIGIFRPSIVIGTSYEHHLPGYIDNIFGPTSLFIGIGLGAFRVLQMNYDSPANIVPADFCANGIIAASHHIAKYSYEEPIIFNFVLDDTNKVTWTGIGENSMERLRSQPTDIQIWYPEYAPVSNPIIFAYYHFLLHIIPGIFFDTILYLRGEEPKLIKLYRKYEVLIVFLTRYFQTYWNFGQKNIKSLFRSLSDEEQIIFNFDMKTFNWPRDVVHVIDGIKLNLVKVPTAATKSAIRRMKIFKFCHFTIKAAYYFIIFYFASMIFQYVFSDYISMFYKTHL